MPITPQEALQRTIEHREIFHDEMLHLMRLIMNGELSPVMTASIITGLRVKKETIGEITAAAQVMREFSTKVHVKDAVPAVATRKTRQRRHDDGARCGQTIEERDPFRQSAVTCKKADLWP